MVAALAACGGGGGTTSTTTPTPTAFTSFSSVPTDGSYTMTGKALTSTYTGLATGAISGPQDASVTVTNAGGTTAKEAISVPGTPSADASWDTANGATVTTDPSSGNTLIEKQTSPTQSTAAYQADATAKGYNYQDYGAWQSDANQSVGVASVGAMTKAANVPTTGGATYTGTSIGVAIDSGGQSYSTTSDITITASNNFKNVAIDSKGTQRTITQTNTPTSGGSAYDFTANGTISGNTFSATLSPGSTLTSGSATGSLYGPNAEEAGGTFQASGNGTHYIGAFGGKQ